MTLDAAITRLYHAALHQWARDAAAHRTGRPANLLDGREAECAQAHRLLQQRPTPHPLIDLIAAHTNTTPDRVWQLLERDTDEITARPARGAPLDECRNPHCADPPARGCSGRCNACKLWWHRHGTERPAHVVALAHARWLDSVSA